MKKLYSFEEVKNILESGKYVYLAGDEHVLEKLPKGNWIGATTPYFMDKKGIFSLDKIFVNDIHPAVVNAKIKSYDKNNLQELSGDRFYNGYTLLILPTFKEVHTKYAFEASQLSNLYDTPIIGWMAGTNLNNPTNPKTYNGQTGEVFEDRGIAMHVELPENFIATLEVINIHQQMENSPAIEFFDDTFEISNCLIEGKETNLAAYISDHKIDIKAPLITNYSGAKINVSFKEVNSDSGKTYFYAPVFKDRKYYFGKSIENYAEQFRKQMPEFEESPEFSCNCILNYLYGDLEGKNVGTSGPITFGEIGYILLNQTLTYLSIQSD